MLQILTKLAEKLQPFRKFTYFVALLLVGVIVTQLLQTPSPTHPVYPYAILSFVACIWLLLLNILLSIFHNIPVDNAPSKSMFFRLKIKVQRCFYHLLALLFLGLTLVIIFLSIRMLRV